MQDNKTVIYRGAYVIIAEGYLKHCHPGGVIGTVEGRLHPGEAFIQKVEGLAETKQHHQVDYPEGQHVPCYHAVDHGDERPGQPDSAVKTIERYTMPPTR